MSQHQPTWASPQQPDAANASPQPPRRRKIGKIIGFWLFGALGLFIVLGIIGEATGAGKSKNTSDSKPTASTTASDSSSPKPSTSAKVTASPKPKKSAKTAAPAKASAPATAVEQLPIAEARKKAAAILEQEDQDFRDFLAQGEDVVGTPQFTAWYQKAIVGLDMQQNAFKKADAYFTADNEPTDLLEAWRSDNGDGDSRITQFASDGLYPDAPNAATRKDAADCLAALAKADKDAEKIANGG